MDEKGHDKSMIFTYMFEQNIASYQRQASLRPIFSFSQAGGSDR